jgi:hypothetical protein
MLSGAPLVALATRSKEQLGSGGADELTHDLALVAAEIVHDNDIAGTKRRQKNLRHIGPKALAMAGAVCRRPWAKLSGSIGGNRSDRSSFLSGGRIAALYLRVREIGLSFSGGRVF